MPDCFAAILSSTASSPVLPLLKRSSWKMFISLVSSWSALAMMFMLPSTAVLSSTA